jgi:hypothetical protein
MRAKKEIVTPHDQGPGHETGMRKRETEHGKVEKRNDLENPKGEEQEDRDEKE